MSTFKHFYGRERGGVIRHHRIQYLPKKTTMVGVQESGTTTETRLEPLNTSNDSSSAERRLVAALVLVALIPTALWRKTGCRRRNKKGSGSAHCRHTADAEQTAGRIGGVRQTTRSVDHRLAQTGKGARVQDSKRGRTAERPEPLPHCARDRKGNRDEPRKGHDLKRKGTGGGRTLLAAESWRQRRHLRNWNRQEIKKKGR